MDDSEQTITEFQEGKYISNIWYLFVIGKFIGKKEETRCKIWEVHNSTLL